MTRRRAELGTLTTGEVGDLIRTKIAEDIITAERKRQVGDQLVIESDALRNKDDDSIKFYQRGTVEASEVSEGASIEGNAAVETSYSEVLTATAKKYAVYGALTREAIEDARVDLVDGVTEEMGEALANKKDELILERLCNDSKVTGETVSMSSLGSTNAGQLTNKPVISIDNVVETNNWDYSPATGSIQTDVSTEVTVDYTIATAPNVASADKDSLSMSDIAKAKYKITGQRLQPDSLVVSPKFISFIEQNSDFISAHTYSGDLPGEVEGRLYGMDVIQSDNLPGQTDNGGYVAIAVDSTKAMPYLQKADLQVERDQDYDKQQMKFYASERYAVGGDSEGSRLLKDNAVAVLAIDHALV